MSSQLRNAADVFLVALRLGLSSFGGPSAHIAYFRRCYVEKLGWLSEEGFAGLLALCQFLPGPTSSQFGFAVGWLRAGWFGALAAWLGFTLPSALLMIGFAYGMRGLAGVGQGGWLLGLKAATVGVVAQAVWKMARLLCPDALRAVLAAASAALVLLVSNAFIQALVIACAGLVGLCFLRSQPLASSAIDRMRVVSRSGALVCLGVMLLLFAAAQLLVAGTRGEGLSLLAALYRSGSLVFGGGHVVLPLLERSVVDPGWISRDSFMAAYGFTQALPGPLFSFSAFVGVVASVGPGGVAGGLLCLAALFLPGLLLVPAVLPFWHSLHSSPRLCSALMGANASVVGLLLAALIHPIFPAGVTNLPSLGIAVLSCAGLFFEKIPVWAIVVAASLAGAAIL